MANVPNSNYVLNPALYGKDIDINNSEILTKPNINGYIIWVMKIWKDSEYRNEALIEAFQEDFAEWTTEIFDVADKLLLRDLRDHLRKNGVFIECKPGIKYAKQLENILKQDVNHNWTEQEIEYVSNRGIFNSRFNPKMYPRQNSPEEIIGIQESQCIGEIHPQAPEKLIKEREFISHFVKKENQKNFDPVPENSYCESRRPGWRLSNQSSQKPKFENPQTPDRKPTN
ncbi:hypothetical protein EPUL_006820 [Erysiphe pulchra]|uniref:Uncharacterized protein n=1 Tax=Erysiphe pulchra TaxID=225359 RepID=A0A2S4PKM2_9PEZI|nr:hypothetical protein EPUL_006820 [Erysiphe pulchra]